MKLFNIEKSILMLKLLKVVEKEIIPVFGTEKLWLKYLEIITFLLAMERTISMFWMHFKSFPFLDTLEERNCFHVINVVLTSQKRKLPNYLIHEN